MTPDLLRSATGCSAERAVLFAGHLKDACEHYGITGPARLAAFLAQIGHESSSLRYTTEVWGPTPAQLRYEGRADLGNNKPGDGFKFKGHGILQVTGRANHSAVRDRMRRDFGAVVPDFEVEPEALAEPRWACLSAADWWTFHGCNELADRGEYIAIGRLINRGDRYASQPANGEADRLERWERAKAALATHASVEPETPPVAVPDEPQDRSEYMPPGEAPDWVPPKPKEKTVTPFIAAALNAVIGAAPELIDMFKGDSKSAQRNSEAAKVVIDVAKKSVGAANEQELIEKLSDPTTAATVRQAVRDNMATIIEAGGGGIGGARAFVTQVASGMQGERMWQILTVVTYAALGFLLLANLIASAAWGVAVWRDKHIESATQFLAQVITADIGASLTALGFWLGSSFGSRQKDEKVS